MKSCCLFIFMPGAEASVETNLRDNPKGAVNRSASISRPRSVEKDQPKPLYTLLPSSAEACTVCEASQSFTSISRGQESLKTTMVNTEPDGDGKDGIIFCIPS